MPSVGKITSPSISFGDISREEINLVLSEAGVSLIPPKKTPFATGIQRRKHAPLKTINQVKEPVVETQPETIPKEAPKEDAVEPAAVEKSITKPKPSSWAALLKSPNNVAKPAAVAPKTQEIVSNQSDKPAIQPPTPKFTGIAGKY
ncbi:hypothetical protein EC973_008674 [Apophysomyces ossiformis]|uniref:Uncharacterized protein n=1 Tax=Apophysomyces ossiformis TaxID=679940 RepID=A0A8H7BQ74_9FUNG|nr:hypothetical protein EC973_008674 [Apophysomyces ossiformis]